MEDAVMESITPESGDAATIQDRLESLIGGEEAPANTPDLEAAEPEEAELEAIGEEEVANEDSQEIDTEPEEASDPEETLELDVEQFAGALGLDVESVFLDDDGTLQLNTKIDGEIVPATLKELIDGYQMEGHYTRKGQKLADQRKEFEQQQAHATQYIQGQISQAAGLIQGLEQQITAEYNSVDWDGLRVQNPAEWSAKKQDFNDRVAQINQAKQQAGQSILQQQQEAQNKHQAGMQEIVQKEAQMLVEKLPEWSNPEAAQAQQKTMSSFLTSAYGFSEQDVAQVYDHRLVLLALDAQKYREGRAAGKVAEKKIKKLPKLIKPGARRTAGADNAKAVKKRRITLKKTGATKDIAAALMDII